MGKRIYIGRHAKSSWAQPGMADHDRPLNDRGLNDAPAMAKLLHNAGHPIEMVISSTARRAKTTASFIAHEYGLELVTESKLYHGDPDDYIDALSTVPEQIKAVALFGHNPGITLIANEIQRNITPNIPTCGIIVAEMDDQISWTDAQWSNMKLIQILTPKDPAL